MVHDTLSRMRALGCVDVDIYALWLLVVGISEQTGYCCAIREDSEIWKAFNGLLGVLNERISVAFPETEAKEVTLAVSYACPHRDFD